MESSRFFVANLPRNTKEQDLRRLFQDYGEVSRVELKTKENLTDPEDVKILAFVTLNIGADDAHYCLNELNWQKVNGAAIKVSLAKESFLERLKREREEAEAAAAGASAATSFVEGGEGASELLSRNSANTRKTFVLNENSDDDEEDDDSIAPDLLITKRRAASSLHNGKIVIQSFDTAPLHVIEAKKHATARQQLDQKSSSADQKRKESLNKKKSQYQQNKTAIQKSLAGLDASGSSANKIKFSDAEEDEEDDSAAAAAKSKTNIFGSDDEDDAAGFKLKPEHFSKKGEKLVQLQSKQSLDPRFKIDAKFVDEDEADAEEAPQTETKKKPNKRSYTREGERDWQMGILEQVVGAKVDTGNAAQKAAKNKKMQRYDPSNDEHQKFLRTTHDDDDEAAEEPTTKAAKKKKSANAQAAEEENAETAAAAAPEVSKEVFYMVTDTLAETLKTRGEGFSLLNMFGQSSGASAKADGGDRRDQLKMAANERILVNKLAPNALNPFSYDSSSDEDGDGNEEEEKEDREEAAAAVVKNGDENVPVTQAKNAKKPQKVKVVMETFFIPKNDARLKEGAKFFKYAKRDAPTENYEEVRNRLKLLIKTKITKSKRNLAGAGGGGGGLHKRKNKRF